VRLCVICSNQLLIHHRTWRDVTSQPFYQRVGCGHVRTDAVSINGCKLIAYCLVSASRDQQALTNCIKNAQRTRICRRNPRFSHPTDLCPNRTAQPKCKLTLAMRPESVRKKLDLIAPVLFELLYKRWKLTPMTPDIINKQINSVSPCGAFPPTRRGRQHYWIASLWVCKG